MRIVRCDLCSNDYVPVETIGEWMPTWVHVPICVDAHVGADLIPSQLRADLCPKCHAQVVEDSIIQMAKGILDRRNAA